MKTTVNFRWEKETKGAVRYKETDANGVDAPYGQYKIGTLYMRKTAFDEYPPEQLSVTLEY